MKRHEAGEEGAVTGGAVQSHKYYIGDDSDARTTSPMQSIELSSAQGYNWLALDVVGVRRTRIAACSGGSAAPERCTTERR